MSRIRIGATGPSCNSARHLRCQSPVPARCWSGSDLPPLAATRIVRGPQVYEEKGEAVPRQARTVVPAANDRVASRQKPSLEKRPARHQLISGVRESFEKCRLSEVGYLRPFKRNLVDIFVSNDTLTYPLDTANELFLRLDERGHRVMLAIDQ
jgi:hypothetical protein